MTSDKFVKGVLSSEGMYDLFVNLNLFCLQHRNSIFIPVDDEKWNIGNNSSSATLDLSDEESLEKITRKNLICMFLKNIESLGFRLGEDSVKSLFEWRANNLSIFLPGVIEAIRKWVGDDVIYRPFYPGFPKQVVDMDEIELYFNALMHYFSNGVYRLDEVHAPTDDIIANKLKSLKEINLIRSKDVLYEIAVNIVNSNTSISEADKNWIQVIWNSKSSEKYVSPDIFYDKSIEDICNMFPESITNKENMVTLVSILISMDDDIDYNTYKKFFNTSTDVLRLIVTLAGGDVSNVETLFEHKRVNFPNKQRKLFIKLLNSLDFKTSDILASDMNRHKKEWLIVSEKIHPLAMKDDRLKKVKDAFLKLHNGAVLPNFYRDVEEAHLNGKILEMADLLSKRPGEFGRKLDVLLRNAYTNKDKETLFGIMDYFKSVVDDISTPVVLQIYYHFLQRFDGEITKRVIYPKSKESKVYVLEDEMDDIGKEYIASVANVCQTALLSRFSKQPFLGKVYIDDSVKGYLLPFSQRSASDTSKLVVRGSRIKINRKESNTIRPFVWWTNPNEKERLDVDLSATFLTEDYKTIDYLDYHNLKLYAGVLNRYTVVAVHSGDLISGGSPNGIGAAEFVDVNLDLFKSAYPNVRYIAIQCFNYTEQKFSDLNVRAGLMTLHSDDENYMKTYDDSKKRYNPSQIFDASNVELKMNMAAKSTSVMPFVYDLKEDCIIWTDLALVGLYSSSKPMVPNNAFNATTLTQHKLDAIINTKKPDLYKLIMIHATARGILTTNKEEADVIFSESEGITPYMLDIIASEYMK